MSIDGGSIYADSITATSLSLNGGSVYADLHGAWGLDASGNVTLAGANDFSGGTTVEYGGTLELASPAALPASGTVEVMGGGTLAMVGGTDDWAWSDITSVLSRVTFDSGSSLGLDTSGGDFSLDSASTTLPVTIFGPGTVTLTGANSFGGVTINAGSTLALGDGTTDGSLAADVTDNGTLVFDTQGNITFDGNICGYGGVIENGPGTLTLAGSNTYSGGTTVAADSGGTLVFPTGGTSSSGTAGNVTVTNTSDSLPTTGILTIGSGTEVVLGTPPGENGGDGQTSNLGGGRLSDSGGSETTPTDVVELYLQPISYGTTNYTTNFEADSNDAISTNTVTTSDASGTIYFDVYAGLNQGDSTHADNGVEFAMLNFTSAGTIGDGTSPSSLGLTLENGFQAGPVASSGSVADLNGDGNLDLGSTNNRSGTGWADFCQNTNVYAAGTGDAAAQATEPTSFSVWLPTRMLTRPTARRRK